MLLSCFEVSARPGGELVVLLVQPPRVWSKGQGRSLKEAKRGPGGGACALDSQEAGSRGGGGVEGGGGPDFTQT